MATYVLAIFVLALAACSGCLGQSTEVAPSTLGAQASPPAPTSANFEVTVSIVYAGDRSLRRSTGDAGRGTVIWLEPIGGQGGDPVPQASFTMTQKDKEFHPRLLVVPVGSKVSFPNADPFFHNVFSLFNGRRFDLGLYQSG